MTEDKNIELEGKGKEKLGDDEVVSHGKKKGKKGKKGEKEEPPPMVPFFSMFRYATKFDVFLMTIGGLAAAANGASM